jgi:hypothetical protein
MENVNNLPETSWQTYNTIENILTVHVSDDPESAIYFQGLPEDYDGGATFPQIKSSEYIAKRAALGYKD